MRGPIPDFNQTSQFVVRKNHGGEKLTEEIGIAPAKWTRAKRVESRDGEEGKSRDLGTVPIRPAAPPDVALFEVHAEQLVARGGTFPPAHQILQKCQNPAHMQPTHTHLAIL